MFLWMFVLVALVVKLGLPVWVNLLVVLGYIWHLFMMYGGD